MRGGGCGGNRDRSNTVLLFQPEGVRQTQGGEVSACTVPDEHKVFLIAPVP